MIWEQEIRGITLSVLKKREGLPRPMTCMLRPKGNVGIIQGWGLSGVELWQCLNRRNGLYKSREKRDCQLKFRNIYVTYWLSLLHTSPQISQQRQHCSITYILRYFNIITQAASEFQAIFSFMKRRGLH